MIVYSASRAEFSNDVFSNQIEKKILQAFRLKLGHSTGKAEIESWKNSMQYMNNVLVAGDIPEDAGVAIEYNVPLTSKRVDFILAGADHERRDTAVIVELKQWSDVSVTAKDAIVETFVGRAQREVAHPSYQAWTYASLIRDFNVEVQEGNIQIRPCAYLHNCIDGSVINSQFYEKHTTRAPAFLRNDSQRLSDFLKRHVRYGDNSKILYRIEHGQLRPSKNLADHLLALLQGNREFEMIDDQKVVYETALQLASKAATGTKQVLLVEGGPGTGKSVVAINLLVEFTNRRLLAHYVTRNSAPRTVYESKLTKSFTKTHVTNLFKGSGSYIDTAPNIMDVLVVDEAHRLNEKSGMYQNQGENQIKEIVQATKLSVFFLDQDQRVTLKDIGDRDEIRRWANAASAELTELRLESQFRCNGSDGYLSWVNHTLQIESTANTNLDGIQYDFRVCESPNELRDLIYERNAANNKARLVAGYCWPWKGKKNPDIKDIVLTDYDFEMKWNLGSDGMLWIISPESVSEVGCIHTCQGLELDYIGVIIGRDFVIRDGVAVTDAGKRSSQDRSIHGYKKMFKEKPDQATALADRVIKNTYRTLMTRGQKGCYIFCDDAETNDYFRNFLELHWADDDHADPMKSAAEPESTAYDTREPF